ncbi:PREDICTED: uncharacterized protein LOC101632752 [Condylura cristata]|uniref:uncharacterized protein LOC101632752 n=1 Tax=Condylura cristata TaxID=143302 RepID=UPI000643AC4D|nr:PREDICTED: uncharacterized protein LOC101632752 [Condylura cristata]
MQDFRQPHYLDGAQKVLDPLLHPLAPAPEERALLFAILAPHGLRARAGPLRTAGPASCSSEGHAVAQRAREDEEPKIGLRGPCAVAAALHLPLHIPPSPHLPSPSLPALSPHRDSDTPSAPVLLTSKDGGQLPPDEALDEAVPEYRAPGRKSLLEIQQLDPNDESLVKYKRALLGPLPPAVDPSLPNVQVTRLTLMSEQAPGPITMDLTGGLAALKSGVFVLKEGVDYRVKITFKVRWAGARPRPGPGRRDREPGRGAAARGR